MSTTRDPLERARTAERLKGSARRGVQRLRDRLESRSDDGDGLSTAAGTTGLAGDPEAAASDGLRSVVIAGGSSDVPPVERDDQDERSGTTPRSSVTADR